MEKSAFRSALPRPLATLTIAATCLALAVWALRERAEAGRLREIARALKVDTGRAGARAQAAQVEAQRQAEIAHSAEAREARSLEFIRFMDAQIGETFSDSTPALFRERMNARIAELFRENGVLAKLEMRERMTYHLRRARGHFTALERYRQQNYPQVFKDAYIAWESENGEAALEEALRLGDDIEAQAAQAGEPPDREVSRDRILCQCLLARFATATGDAASAREHLLAARALLLTLAEGSPFSPVQYADWMRLPNLDAAMGDLDAAVGSTVAARGWYREAVAFQALLAEREPEDGDRKAELERLRKCLRKTSP